MRLRKNSCLLIVFSIAILGASFLAVSCDIFGTDGDNYTSETSAVTSVVVSPSTLTISKGNTQQFSATVNVTGYAGQYVTWSLEGLRESGTTLSNSGLLTVAANEYSGRTLTVRATSTYDETKSGTATVNIATESQIPSGLKALKPSSSSIELSWNGIEGATSYKIYRSTDGTAFSTLGNSETASYTDSAVTEGAAYYYTVSAVAGGNETGQSSKIYAFAADYFALPEFTERQDIPANSGVKHYYRFPVVSGESYTIQWDNGSNENTNRVYVLAWQNDGTVIFAGNTTWGDGSGYTNPLVFTASITGYITVEVGPGSGYAVSNYDYRIYCLMKEDVSDTGVVAMPPGKVTGFTVTTPSETAISLEWNAVEGATTYNIYRATTKDATAGKIGESTSTSFVDILVSEKAYYYYTIAAENSDAREGLKTQVGYGIAAAHYSLPSSADKIPMSISSGQKHFYRLAVTKDQSYTISWDNGSNENTNRIYVLAWQNDGTVIFAGNTTWGDGSGYTNPLVFTASATGYVTVEVGPGSGYAVTNYSYRIYHY